jgi:hypothetical protein
MVDMFIALQESISLTQHLNLTLAENELVARSSHRARNRRSARLPVRRRTGGAAHGGMGMSDELNIGHYSSGSPINIQFGDPTYHLLRYARKLICRVSKSASYSCPEPEV